MPKPFSKSEVEEFFARLQKLDPEPKTELQYVNPYTLLVAVVLSAQATDKGVNKATAPLFRTVKTPVGRSYPKTSLLASASTNPVGRSRAVLVKITEPPSPLMLADQAVPC